MYYLYYLCCKTSSKFYVGYTNNLKKRLVTHRSAASRGRKTPLYDLMRKHSPESFFIIPVVQNLTKEQILHLEREVIKNLREVEAPILNCADGGEGGFVVPEEKLLEWKEKLSKSRQGRKPALGMRHTVENKKFFSECAKRKTIIYSKAQLEGLTFKDAKAKLGISKTHYYRILKN